MHNQTVIKDSNQMIGKTGWTRAAAKQAAREHAAEARRFPDPVERALARFPEFEDGVDFGDEPNLDEVLAHRRDERQDRRTHRTVAQRIAHRHGECACFKHS